MNDTLASLLLGIIEGITEFLPISSTGHLLIAEHWLGARSDLFNIAIQAGAILAVVLIYRARLLELVLGLGQARNRTYALKLALAFGVTAVLGLLVKKLGVELPETLAPIAWALLIGGFAILAIEAIDARRPDLPDNDPDAISWGTAALVGLAQVLAGVFPGTSRSAAAIFAALLFGRSSRVAATEFAFLVGIPTMFAATGYELLHVLKDGGAAGEDWSGLGIAFVASAITAFVAVKWLLAYIQTHRFTVFAWYRIVLGAALLAWAMGEHRNDVPTAVTVAPASAAAWIARPDGQVAGNVLADASAAARLPSRSTGSGAAGAAVAASPARGAAFEVIRGCLADDAQRRLYADPNFESVRQAALASMPRAQAALAQREYDLEAERLRLDRWHCRERLARAADGDPYALALAAADAGDRRAAECYVTAMMPMSERMRRDQRAFVAYQVNARRLIQAGIDAGDWAMVEVAAYSARGAGARPPKEWRRPTWIGPGDDWLHQLERADPEREYALHYLMALGSRPDEEDGAAMVSMHLRDALPDEIAVRAETWAKQQFSVRFGGRRDRQQRQPCLGGWEVASLDSAR